MPIYTFLDSQTEEYHEKLMTYSSREDYLKENPNLIVVPSSAAIGDPVRMGMKKPDAGFREVLQKIKSKHIRSTVNTW